MVAKRHCLDLAIPQARAERSGGRSILELICGSLTQVVLGGRAGCQGAIDIYPWGRGCVFDPGVSLIDQRCSNHHGVEREWASNW
jgi:hypothetical protein